MRKSLLATAILGALATPVLSYADDAPAAAPAAAAEPAPDWTATANIGLASDYYFRGISQSWHKPAVQGGFDISHSSGFYLGTWGSNVTPNTYPDANLELDIYGGYNGTISSVEGLGWTAGLYGYLYPNGSWKKYRSSTGVDSGGVPGALVSQTPNGGRWNTYEANFGVSYKWISAKASVTLSNWFGAEKETGWDGSTRGSTYLELNANYPLPWGGLTLVGHIGHLNVAGKLDENFSPDGGTNKPSTSISGATSPDYTDWKIGLNKSFAIGKAEGWNAGIYYVEATNDGYWGKNGYGGTSFNGKGSSTTAESRNLNDGRLIVTLGRTF